MLLFLCFFFSYASNFFKIWRYILVLTFSLLFVFPFTITFLPIIRIFIFFLIMILVFSPFSLVTVRSFPLSGFLSFSLLYFHICSNQFSVLSLFNIFLIISSFPASFLCIRSFISVVLCFYPFLSLISMFPLTSVL